MSMKTSIFLGAYLNCNNTPLPDNIYDILDDFISEKQEKFSLLYDSDSEILYLTHESTTIIHSDSHDLWELSTFIKQIEQQIINNSINQLLLSIMVSGLNDKNYLDISESVLKDNIHFGLIVFNH